MCVCVCRCAREQDGRAAWVSAGSAAGLSPLCASSSSPSSTVGSASSTAGSAADPSAGNAFPLQNAFRAAADSVGDGGGGGGGGGVGRSWVPQFRATAVGWGSGGGAPPPPRIKDLLSDGDAASLCPSSAVPVFGDFPPLSAAETVPGAPGAAAAAVEGIASTAGCGAGVNASARVTAPSTPLPAAVGAGEGQPASQALRDGDAVEAQFLLVDQAVWTTSWYRGQVSRVNRAGDACAGVGGGGGEGGGATYGVDFADGDSLAEVPEGHIRLFRGLQVGSVVSVEWPDKGGLPFKGCLTGVSHGNGDNGSPTVSVIYEDTDTEVRRTAFGHTRVFVRRLPLPFFLSFLFFCSPVLIFFFFLQQKLGSAIRRVPKDVVQPCPPVAAEPQDPTTPSLATFFFFVCRAPYSNPTHCSIYTSTQCLGGSTTSLWSDCASRTTNFSPLRLPPPRLPRLPRGRCL